MTVVTVSPRVTQVTISRGPAGVGVPTGGATAQVLRKSSGADYDTAWADPAVTSAQISDATATGLSLLTAASASEARTALGLGSLALASSITASQISDATTAGRSLLTAADAAAQRTALGLGALAVQSTITASQISDSTTAGRSLLTAADAAAQRTALGLAAVASSGSASDLGTGTIPAARIGNSAITLAKMANLAANSIIGNNTGSSSVPLALSVAQAQSLLGLATVATSGSAADLGAGTLPDARLSANVAMQNASNTFTGVQLFPDGTVSAPAIAFSAEASTGWYRSAASTPSLAIAGIEALRVNINGITAFVSSLTPPSPGGFIGSFAYGAFDGTAWDNSAGRIRLSAAEAWSSTAHGTDMELRVRKTGSISAEWVGMRIYGASGGAYFGQQVAIGGSAVASDLGGGILLSVSPSSSGRAWTPNANLDVLTESSAIAGLHVVSGATSEGRLWFSDTDAELRGALVYDHNADEMSMSIAGTKTLRLRSFGSLSLGGTLDNACMSCSQDMTGVVQATSYGLRVNYTAPSIATTILGVSLSTIKGGNAASAYTTANFYGFNYSDMTPGTNQTITASTGFQCNDMASGQTNYGFRGMLTSGSNKFNLYMSGSADNYMAGWLGIGSSSKLGAELLRISGGTVATAGATDVTLGGGSIDMGTALRYRGTQVVGARKTGWTAPTGTATRTTFDTATVTLSVLAEHVKALIDDLHATAGHGLIGT